MEKGNVCLFVPWRTEVRSISVLNFVFETERQPKRTPRVDGLYKMHIVSSGKGLLHTAGSVEEVEAGDVFFTFPSTPYSIESGEDFSYYYMSFVGAKGNMILDRIGVCPGRCIFGGFEELLPAWENALKVSTDLRDIMCEGLLMQSFAILGDRLILPKREEHKASGVADLVKKYVEDNYSDPNLTLEKASAELSYHPKYISHVFKREMKIGFSQYLSTIRVSHAATMLEQGFTAISDVSSMCGFSDAQYFSKVFKAKTGVAPSKYLILRDKYNQ